MPLRDQSTPLYQNRTGTHLSTNIILLVNNRAIAAVKTLAITESRGISMINEIGSDGHIDSAPNKSTDVSGSCSRTRFNRTRIAEAFDRGFVHVAAQRVPFEIVIQDNFQGSDDDSKIITTIRNVWIERIEVTYSAEDFVIVENMNWQAESIDSHLGNQQNVVGISHAGNSQPNIINPFEASADFGTYRGALDGAGLINAVVNGTL